MHCIKFDEIQYDLKGSTLHSTTDLKNMLSVIKVKSHAP